jgi:hypothetical protein
MAFKKLKDWHLKRRIKEDKNAAALAVQEARRILEARNQELLFGLRKTVREEVVKTGPRRKWVLVSVGKKQRFDPIKYKAIGDYHAEIGHKGDIANFTYTKVGKAMLFTDLAVGPYYRNSSLRRLGIAGLMIEIAKEIAQREGLAAIRISSDPTSPWLKEMYKKHGFVSLSETSDYAQMIYFIDKTIEAKFDPRRPWAILEYLKS